MAAAPADQRPATDALVTEVLSFDDEDANLRRERHARPRPCRRRALGSMSVSASGLTTSACRTVGQPRESAKAADATEAQAAPDCPTPRRRSRCGDLRGNPPHSQGLGCHLWPGRRDGRPIEARPSCRLCTPAPRPSNENPLASRRQRQGRGVPQPLPQWQRRPPAAFAGKGRRRVRREEPLQPGAIPLARLEIVGLICGLQPKIQQMPNGLLRSAADHYHGITYYGNRTMLLKQHKHPPKSFRPVYQPGGACRQRQARCCFNGNRHVVIG
jgi:hypothetical protein